MRTFVTSAIKLLHCVTFAIALASCNLTSDNDSFTTVEGIITNRYTGLPVAAAPVTVGRRSSGFGYKQYDSLTTIYSDATGHYVVSFNASKQKNSLIYEQYVVHVLYSHDLFDLTSQPYAYPWNGIETELGKANKINIEVTPYKKVTIKVPAGKSGRNSIHLDFNSTDRENWFGNIILADTNRTRQFVGFSQIINVLPNRSYRFYRQLYGGGSTITDSQDRQVFYNDTTAIIFR